MEYQLLINVNDRFDIEDQLKGPIMQIEVHKEKIQALPVGGKWALFAGEDFIVGYICKLA